VRAELDTIRVLSEAAPTPQRRRNQQDRFMQVQGAFLDDLAAVRVLDPACGSGNFLYVAMGRLLELEKEVIRYGAEAGLPIGIPNIRPHQLLGLEIDPLARELAQVAIWIGYLQWMIANGFGWKEPVLETLETIRLQDALLDFSGGKVCETVWPKADFIVGNPPFLGSQKLRNELGSDYADSLFAIFSQRVPSGGDLCAYFFEKARIQIQSNQALRAGLLATQTIRSIFSRKVLERIKNSGDIFMAWSDEPWLLDGAAVRISIVGFDNGEEQVRTLDGMPVEKINADLKGTLNIASALTLPENHLISFEGDKKAGPFEVDSSTAMMWLKLPLNPNGRPNSDVVKPWVNGLDITRRPREIWIVDFGVDMPEEQAALYEAPFQYILKEVKPLRLQNRDQSSARKWWLHQRPRPLMRESMSGLSRYLVVPRVSKHRMFVWLNRDTLPDSQLTVFSRDDDYFFGVLHSRAHEIWSLRMGTSLEDRPRCTPTTCFETFALPWAPGTEPVDDPRVIAIGEAAKRLNELRENWLNPEGASGDELKKRTLTNLYNTRPTWLANAHAALDRAVWAAYGWEDDPAMTTDEQILERLLALNLERAATL